MTPAYYAALCELSDDLCHAFAEVPVHAFGYSPAKSRTGGVKAVGTGPHAGRVLYGAQAQKALAAKKGGGGAKPAAKGRGGKPKPKPAQQPAPAQPSRPGPAEKAKAAVLARRQAAQPPASPAAPNTGAEWAQKPLELAGAPPVPPAASQHLDQAKAADTQKYGGSAASVLHRTGVALLRFFLKGLGAAGGAAIGAAAGFGLSGGNPLGAVAGGLAGGVLGGNSLTAPRNLTVPRMRALARKTARAVVPTAAGVATAAPGVLGGATLGVGGGLAAGPAGAVGFGVPGAMVIGGSLDGGNSVAQATRKAMATSAVSRRKAQRRNARAPFSEFADATLPPDAVRILKARVIAAAKAAGVELGDVPDEVVASALRLAEQDAGAAAMGECWREAKRAARNLSNLARA